MKLWLIRHANAAWGSSATTDFLRPLNARGQQDGPRMAAWLARQRHPASWVWTSDAVRARETARFVVDGFASAAATLVEDHRLYDAGPERLLDVVRETPAEAAAAAVVAHNPGITELVNLLAGETVSDMPTFGIACLDVPAPWAELAFRRGRLELLSGPRQIGEEP